MMAKKAKKSAKSRDFSSKFYREIEKLQKKFDITDKELIELVSAKKYTKEKIPVCILSSRLSSFQAVVKYLRENCTLNFREIGELLNRSKFTIASAYRSAKSELPEKFVIRTSEFDIPAKNIADRRLSVLESIVYYLKEKFNLTLKKIAELLNLDQRTIWTVCNRAKTKLKLKT
jgi:DNA-binding CsgD family transcriptional regulator